MRAAVPEYLGTNFSAIPPGHRFGVLFSGWQEDWTKPDKSLKGYNKIIEPLPVPIQKMTEGLCSRQQNLADEQTLSVAAKSIAPFATGLGNEHPTENGFAFLNPYGIPYLPGSGVKGVMRSAACELLEGVDGEHSQWSIEVIDQLFGREWSGDENPGSSGALIFWDVIPKMHNHRMEVEIMNPHYGEYYQQGGTPNDCTNPIPIFFLTVPSESEFHFHVQCRNGRLQEDLQIDWQQLIRELFTYAFDWVGFGTKTSVGYGAMIHDESAEERIKNEKKERELSTLSKDEKLLHELKDMLLRAQKNGNEEPGGPLSAKLSVLLNMADDWPQQSKSSLADLAENIYELVGWGPKKKKPLKVTRIKQLRDEL
ncbi:MAG: type III-B CRISPR module RAMP protein Cmr6 [Gammaproteobacteria bacterium]|jgi:CRISPR-associated protein Cmr6|nr:type III-B CRISPR module RAMP protein Cmr6 [Gammaproteobacteria bacterium]MBT4605618.1 type III-B CRISPR module RAMP protein Cmr6 [Thiotrichales bacterium]MBT7828635.1 type III-B CRISPR module RAMP protein Cmr6 [Candidatus Neomarinimicrobiota bacterium]MBT3968177.1 type III-B CRISPR module RAMP protein Cmr6 [Gammaproteobacteria bacterium]MBT5635603.1 type III-B CRISPR module RAMP protein Cmr6 [Gammaproteobacteria bacterium]